MRTIMEPEDELAALRAERDELRRLRDAVLAWASAPGDHGGNPWCKDFVRMAEKARAALKGGVK